MMSLRPLGLLLALALCPLGCDVLPGGPGSEDVPPPAPMPMGFEGTLSGTATVAGGLDPSLLRVGAFAIPEVVPTELDNGDLADANVTLDVEMIDASITLVPVEDEASGVERYLLVPAIVTDVDPNSGAWSLNFFDTAPGDHVVIAWYDEDGDGQLALTPDGEGSEPHLAPSRPEPSVAADFRFVLEGIWWDQITWTGNAAGPVGDGTFHEAAITSEIADGWEAALADPEQ